MRYGIPAYRLSRGCLWMARSHASLPWCEVRCNTRLEQARSGNDLRRASMMSSIWPVARRVARLPNLDYTQPWSVMACTSWLPPMPGKPCNSENGWWWSVAAVRHWMQHAAHAAWATP